MRRSLKMATVFIARRFLSSSSLLCRQPVIRPERVPTTATPEYLELLEKSREKSLGHWSKMSKEEMQVLHKARYGKRLAEFKDTGTGRGYGPGGGKKVFFGTSLGVGLGILLDYVLDETVGREKPHTLNNPEWDEATRKRLLKQHANPIEGISSRSSAN